MNFQKKILVVEDDLGLGATIQQILIMYKYDVCYANNGAAGIQKAFEYNPDLILCDINMDPLDGYQVFRVLEESSILNRIPFVFLTGSSDLEDIRFGMSLGADDYIVKPFNNSDLIKTIEKRLEKFTAIREDATREFDRLFNLSPVGIIVFDGTNVIRANQAFLKLLDKKEGLVNTTPMVDLIDSDSFKKLQKKLDKYLNSDTEIFNEVVLINNTNPEGLQKRLIVSEFEKYSNYNLFIGLFTSVTETLTSSENNQYANEVYNLLKRENIKISDALGEQITNIFKKKPLNIKNYNNSFFTARENQVLYLSMEGLPIKSIADRLSISDRTVEKHRTRLMEKSGASNMIEVIVFALRNSLVEI